MKIKHTLFLIALSITVGCAYFKVVGTDFDSYVQRYGSPSSQTTLANGNTLYSYKSLCSDKINWKKYTVEVSPENIIVKKTFTNSCPIYTDIQGKDFDSYVQKYGVSVNEYTLRNRNTLYSYKDLCPDKMNWQEFNIEVTPQRTIVQRTDIKACPI